MKDIHPNLATSKYSTTLIKTNRIFLQVVINITNKPNRNLSMTLPRSQLISLESTPYYHCVTRCVRRAYLCGIDPDTGKDYQHRRKWIEDRIFYLADRFSIKVAAYSVMSNHYHIVLRINKEEAKKLTFVDIIERWHGMFNGNQLSQRYIEDSDSLTDVEKGVLIPIVEEWRKRLYDISWFMRCLNEDIARLANFEDKCTGRFWQGRFKSQALLDEKAITACMAYVDLNPIRAKISDDAKTSDFTSIKKRHEHRYSTEIKEETKELQQRVLLPMKDDGHADINDDKTLPFNLAEYVALLEWTRENIHKPQKHDNKSLKIAGLKVTPKNIKALAEEFERHFKSLVGTAKSYKQSYHKFKMRRRVGLRSCAKYLE